MCAHADPEMTAELRSRLGRGDEAERELLHELAEVDAETAARLGL